VKAKVGIGEISPIASVSTLSRRAAFSRIARIFVGTTAAVNASTPPREATASPRTSETDGTPPRRRLYVPASNGTDDTRIIQSALDDGAGGEVVFATGGTWFIDASAGLAPRSNTVIRIEAQAKLEVIPNGLPSYRLFNIGRDGAVHNVTIQGSGTLVGDSGAHTGQSGEYGHLIYITNGSSEVRILGPLAISRAWGDGIYIGGGSYGNCKEVLIDGVTVSDCRREGIAAFWVDGCIIRNCHVHSIGATSLTGPATGIDCEPNPEGSGNFVNRLTIENCLVEDTPGIGIFASENTGPITNLIIRNNTVRNCGRGYPGREKYKTNGIHVAGVDQPIIINNTVQACGSKSDESGASGQILLRACNRPLLALCDVSDGLGRGVFIWACTASRIEDLSIERNLGSGLAAYRSNGTAIRRSRLADNLRGDAGGGHLEINTSNHCVIEGNTFRGDTGSSWVTVQPSASDNLIANNIGFGRGPINEISNRGLGTTEFGNVREIDGSAMPWSAAG